MKLSILNRVKELYEKENKNIVEYLKSTTHSEFNSIDDILISYDFQAGTYTNSYESNPHLRDETSDRIAAVINKLGSIDSFLEVGVGEATTLALLMKRLKNCPSQIKGLDLSWSRIKYANQFLLKQGIRNAELVTGDLFAIPLMDNSMDMVFTFQAIEPNGGREKEALQELYRVSNEYIVLVEPCYEIANEQAKERMHRNGYVKGLYKQAVELGYNVVLHEPLGCNLNELNPVTIMVIKKDKDANVGSYLGWSCPITKTKLKIVNNAYYSKESLLAYPIIGDVPCLLSSNAIVATRMLDE